MSTGISGKLVEPHGYDCDTFMVSWLIRASTAFMYRGSLTLIDKQGGSKIGSRNRRWFPLSHSTVSAQSLSMRPKWWSLACASLSSRLSLSPG
jgi:hypothetical protein